VKNRLEEDNLARNLKGNLRKRAFGSKSEESLEEDVQCLNQARNCGEAGFRVQIPEGNQQGQSSGQIPRGNFTSRRLSGLNPTVRFECEELRFSVPETNSRGRTKVRSRGRALKRKTFGSESEQDFESHDLRGQTREGNLRGRFTG
jgi:hypothetical protein